MVEPDPWHPSFPFVFQVDLLCGMRLKKQSLCWFRERPAPSTPSSLSTWFCERPSFISAVLFSFLGWKLTEVCVLQGCAAAVVFRLHRSAYFCSGGTAHVARCAAGVHLTQQVAFVSAVSAIFIKNDTFSRMQNNLFVPKVLLSHLIKFALLR